MLPAWQGGLILQRWSVSSLTITQKRAVNQIAPPIFYAYGFFTPERRSYWHSLREFSLLIQLKQLNTYHLKVWVISVHGNFFLALLAV